MSGGRQRPRGVAKPGRRRLRQPLLGRRVGAAAGIDGIGGELDRFDRGLELVDGEGRHIAAAAAAGLVADGADPVAARGRNLAVAAVAEADFAARRVQAENSRAAALIDEAVGRAPAYPFPLDVGIGGDGAGIRGGERRLFLIAQRLPHPQLERLGKHRRLGEQVALVGRAEA